jgi:hypothetical protein
MYFVSFAYSSILTSLCVLCSVSGLSCILFLWRWRVNWRYWGAEFMTDILYIQDGPGDFTLFLKTQIVTTEKLHLVEISRHYGHLSVYVLQVDLEINFWRLTCQICSGRKNMWSQCSACKISVFSVAQFKQ